MQERTTFFLYSKSLALVCVRTAPLENYIWGKMMKIIYIAFAFLVLSPFVFADAYGNSSYGNGSYIGYTSSPAVSLTVNPERISTVSSSQITCAADDSWGVISVNIRVDDNLECNTTNYAGQAHMDCSFSFNPSSHNDITKNYSISCRTENIGGLTTNATGSLYALKDTGGASSSGGGGAASPAPTETFIFSQILPDEPVTKKLSNPNIAVKEIDIELNNQTSNARITVARFDGTPSQTPKGNAFQYLQVNTTISELKSVRFRFNVTKTWLLQVGANTTDVALQRLSGIWQKLPTRLLGESSSEAEYEADVPGFSLFAVTAEKIQPAPPPVPQQPPPTQQQDAQSTVPNLTKGVEDLSKAAGEISDSLGKYASMVLNAVRGYARNVYDYLVSLLPAQDSRDRTLYLFAIFVAVQFVVYIAIIRALHEKKPHKKPIHVRHNEKLHQFLIAIIVAVILAVAIFWLRI